jgi:hypothetical protein
MIASPFDLDYSDLEFRLAVVEKEAGLPNFSNGLSG